MSDSIKLTEGHSYTTIIRLETDPIVRKAITSITAPNGCALIHVPAHGVKDGWRVAVTNAKHHKTLAKPHTEAPHGAFFTPKGKYANPTDNASCGAPCVACRGQIKPAD